MVKKSEVFSFLTGPHTPTHPQGIFSWGLGWLPLVHSFIHSLTKVHWKPYCVHGPTHLGSGWPSGTRLSAPTNPIFLLAPFLGAIGGLGAQAEPPRDPSLPGGSLRTSSPLPRAPKSQAWEHHGKGPEAGTRPWAAGPASATVAVAKSCSPVWGSQRTPAQPFSRAGSLIFKELSRTFQELPDTIFCDACAVRTSVFYT